MFTKLAVPLDGSPLAEKALGYAVRLANLLNANLLLLEVADTPNRAVRVHDSLDHEIPVVEPPEEYIERMRTTTLYPALAVKEELFNDRGEIVSVHADAQEKMEAYLREVQETITNPAVEPHLPAERVQIVVVYGKPAHEIAAVAAAQGADLLVMTTHGRGGLSLLVTGSIASSVVQHSSLPVVLMRPENTEQTVPAEPLSLGFRVGPVVVTLDGTPEAEIALKPAIELARQLEAPLHVLQVINPAPSILATRFGSLVYEEGGVYEALTELKELANGYLGRVQARLEEAGVKCNKVVRVGPPSAEIVEYTKLLDASMLVMATHSRGRFSKVLLGSVAEDVIKLGHQPVMLVHIRAHAKSNQPVVNTPVGI